MESATWGTAQTTSFSTWERCQRTPPRRKNRFPKGVWDEERSRPPGGPEETSFAVASTEPWQSSQPISTALRGSP